MQDLGSTAIDLAAPTSRHVHKKPLLHASVGRQSISLCALICIKRVFLTPLLALTCAVGLDCSWSATSEECKIRYLPTRKVPSPGATHRTCIDNLGIYLGTYLRHPIITWPQQTLCCECGITARWHETRPVEEAYTRGKINVSTAHSRRRSSYTLYTL